MKGWSVNPTIAFTCTLTGISQTNTSSLLTIVSGDLKSGVYDTRPVTNHEDSKKTGVHRTPEMRRKSMKAGAGAPKIAFNGQAS
jgi:hypothetical protein